MFPIADLQRWFDDGWQRLKLRGAKRAITIVADAQGITQIELARGRKSESFIAWTDVASIFAYKRDCYAYDLVCLAICDADFKVRVEVSEEDEGFAAMVELLPVHLSGCKIYAEWFFGVAFPALEENLTEVYRRQAVRE